MERLKIAGAIVALAVGVLTLLRQLAPVLRWADHAMRRWRSRLAESRHGIWGFVVTLPARWEDHRTRGSWTPAVGDYIWYDGNGQVDSGRIMEIVEEGDDFLDPGELWVMALGFG